MAWAHDRAGAAATRNKTRAARLLARFRNIRSQMSEAAVRILFAGELEVRAGGNEIDIQTLVSPAVFAEAIALKIFEVDPPAPVARIVGCEIAPGAWRSLADPFDVLPDLDGKIADVARVPGVSLVRCAALGQSRQSTAQETSEGQ